ncbi:hypothetical protein G1H11_06345 [Phytoactinopolyspora alkaliphila]|uniref:DUF8129 domain-containing protein n=1 Tax=Phytoactinopolyspora alkaliphila TaxID=1783498 RepID=A0A6N9YJ80_9ACTN|nr:hypothetical protein [Phytoactinopolyspora alkaliphila]NED94929.1 hypothetical protein [Phytoactinopolyspora alkaliphila]
MTHHEELPLEGYDQMTVGTIRDAIRSLDEEQLQKLLEHEHSHADRPLVKEIMTNRMVELSAGAEPTEGEPPSVSPSAQPRGKQKVGPETTAEPIIPPAHGVPTGHRPRQGPRR